MPTTLSQQQPTAAPTTAVATAAPVVAPPAQSGNTAGFNIQLIRMGDTDVKYAQYFESAKARWESIITGDLVNLAENETPPGGWFSDFFSSGNYFGPVDDIVIGKFYVFYMWFCICGVCLYMFISSHCSSHQYRFAATRQLS
jgi:hypothetical protein